MAEIIELCAFDVHHSDHSPAHNQRHRQFGPYGVHRIQVARIFRDIPNANCFPAGGGGADYSVAHRNAPVLDDLIAVPDREPEIQSVGTVVVQQYGENFVLNQPLHVGGGAGKHIVQIERRVDFLADFGKDRQRLRRDLHLRIQSSRVHLNFRVMPPGIDDVRSQPIIPRLEQRKSIITGDKSPIIPRHLNLANERFHYTWAAASEPLAAASAMIFAPELLPILVAPASTILKRSARERTPPEAFTPISLPTLSRSSRTSPSDAPPGPK